MMNVCQTCLHQTVTIPLSLLAPEIVEAILAGRQPPELTMAKAMQPFPTNWTSQCLEYDR